MPLCAPLREFRVRSMRLVRVFLRAKQGNIAIIFALSLIPMVLAAGGGIDFTRALIVRAHMSAALDAAALAVGASSNLTTAQMQTLAQKFFTANFTEDSSYGTPAAVTVVTGTQSITITASCNMPTMLIRIAGINTIPVSATTKVVWGQLKLWVSLVLDNTGSMATADSTGTTKIAALKTAAKQLLTILSNAASVDGDVRVSVVPFARSVYLGYTSSSAPSWIRFDEFVAPPSVTISSSVGPGSSCPFTYSSSDPASYRCAKTPTNDIHCNVNNNSDGNTNCTSTVPSSGTYKGYICPSVTNSGHYYNGCFNSVQSGSTCSSYNRNGSCASYTYTYNHTWVTTYNPLSTWGGCVTDRDQNYDVNDTTPSTSSSSTLFVAENSPGCTGSSIMTLTSVGTSSIPNLTDLNSKIDSLVASGSTNQTIGLAWGWETMTQGLPLSPTTLPDDTNRVIILLSDGLNTQDRWYGNGNSDSSGQINVRMTKVCDNAKADGVIIYSIFVDLNGTTGSSTVLQNCATDSSKYFDLTTSGAIITAFNTIGQQITNLRVSQ